MNNPFLEGITQIPYQLILSAHAKGNFLCSTIIKRKLAEYCKVPKFSNATLYCNSPKILTKKPNLKVFCLKHANGIANNENADQSALLVLSSLIWACTVRPDLSVRKFWIITVVPIDLLWWVFPYINQR